MKKCFLLLLIGLLSACTAESGPVHPIRPGVALLIVGDGLSGGEEFPSNQDWVGLMEEKMRSNKTLQDTQTIVNMSSKDNNSWRASQKLSDILQQHHPQAVVIEFALNESAQTKNQFRQQITQMVHLSREEGAQVILMKVKMPYIFKLTGNNIEEVYDEVAQTQKVPVVNFPLNDIFEQGLVQSDRTHPSLEAQLPLMNTMEIQLRPWVNSLPQKENN